jgi:cold shock CspA family protein
MPTYLRNTGYIASYFPDKAYGFIQRDDATANTKRVYMRPDRIRSGVPAVGRWCSFVIFEDARGVFADHIDVLDAEAD